MRQNKYNPYLRAAKRMFKHPAVNSNGCCYYLSKLSVVPDLLMETKIESFCDLFSPYHNTRGYWGVFWVSQNLNYNFSAPVSREKIKNCRILALLFAHAMHKTGDL